MLFKNKDLKGKQRELKEMAYITHLEEIGKVYVGDLAMLDIKEVQEVLESLNYITEYKSEYLVLVSK